MADIPHGTFRHLAHDGRNIQAIVTAHSAHHLLQIEINIVGIF